MINLIRETARETKIEAYQRLDEMDSDPTVRNRLLNASADACYLDLDLVGDPFRQNPEQIYIMKELYARLYRAMDAVGSRYREFLLYRFGFEDGDEHSVPETAEHFISTRSTVEDTEFTALNLMRRKMTG